MKRERFGSRIGFILISAGCAIGLGNVYRFPITTGAFGGAFFVLMYIVFLILLGIPVMTMELTVGRASQKSIASSFDVLQPNRKWHFMKYLGIGGNYIIMMFYTVIAGWMCIYFLKYLTGGMESLSTSQEYTDTFVQMIKNPWQCTIAAFAVIFICFGICSFGLKNGVERITKYMMLALLFLMVGLAVYACTLDGALEGLKFYLVPSIDNFIAENPWNVICSAMGQAFFTLSIGMGSIAIFGSYIGKERRLLGESVVIVSLDTFVALVSGFIIFPACFTFAGGINTDANTVGASFLFTTLSEIFGAMKNGRIVGSLFFVFMIFASFSTVIAVFENIISFWREGTNLSTRKIALINVGLICVLCLPAAFSSNLLENVQINSMNIITVEDFIISNNILPFGSLIYVLFCTYNKHGWGWSNFVNEANTGEKGLKFPTWARVYVKYVLPFVIFAVWISSIILFFR